MVSCHEMTILVGRSDALLLLMVIIGLHGYTIITI